MSTKKKGKTAKPPKPKAVTVKKSRSSDDTGPSRKRNETKKADDEVLKKHNKTTIPIGPVEDILNPLLKQDVTFRKIFDTTLLHWQAMENEMRIHVNIALRETFNKIPHDAELSIDALAKLNNPESSAKSIIDFIFLLSPHPKVRDKLEAKKFPSEAHSQIVKNLEGNLKSLLINNFMRVLIIYVRRLLDIEFRGEVGGGVAKLIAAFLMGRKGVISKKGNEEEDEEVDKEGDGAGQDDDMNDDQLSSIDAFRKVLKRRILKKGVNKRAKDAISRILAEINGENLLTQLRSKYLPSYLNPLVDQWMKKISADGYANAPIVWKLFAEVNRTEFVQHLFPTPSTKGIYRKITSTLLSAILTYYLKSKKSAKEPIPDGIIPEDLEAKEYLHYWTKIPHTVWNIVISSFVDERALHGQKLQFDRLLHHKTPIRQAEFRNR